MRPVSLETLSSPGCQICRSFEEFWHSIAKDWANVTYKNTSVVTPEGQELVQKHMIFSSPAIILDGQLFSMGGFDRNKFIEKLQELSKE